MKNPVIRIVKTCPETKAGDVYPYTFASPCVKCGRAIVELFGKPKDDDAFEATKLEPPDQGKVVFLCKGMRR